MKKSTFISNILLASIAVVGGITISWFVSDAPTSVHGTVLLDGQRVPFARVIFVPDDSSQEAVSTTADHNGEYQFAEDIPEGSYRIITTGKISGGANLDGRLDELDDYQKQMVSTSQPNEAEMAIPDSYFSVVTSPLSTTVATGEQQFDVKATSGVQVADESKRNGAIR